MLAYRKQQSAKHKYKNILLFNAKYLHGRLSDLDLLSKSFV